MITVFIKMIYLLIILFASYYLCAYLNQKINARIELRRGYTRSHVRGFGYPAIRLMSYINKDTRWNPWSFIIFIFSIAIWTFIPVTSNLIIADVDFGAIVVISFYLIILFLNLAHSMESKYNHIYSNSIKKYSSILSYSIPVIISVANVVLISGSFNLNEIVNSQYEFWNIVYQPLGFVVFFISMFVQFKLLKINSRNTFLNDKGSVKEGKGLDFLITRISGYSIIFFLIMMISILYLGGWQNIYFIRGEILVFIKFYLIFIFLLILDNSTINLDDYRYLNNINWKFLVPLSIANLFVTVGFLFFRNFLGVI